jgi:uncharacterized protein
MRIASSLIASLFLSLTTVGCATSVDTDTGTLEAFEGEAATAGKLTLWQATDGQFHFNLKSGNGAVLLTSEAYTSRTGAINGALSLLSNGVDPAMYEVVATKTGFVVHLLAANTEIISFSEVYSSKSNANRAVASCVRAVTSYLDKRESLAAGPRVDVAAGETGKFHFNVVGKTGRVVLTSESYETEAAAFNGAFAAQAASASAYTIKQNNAGGFYFTVQANNNEIVGVSQQFATREAAEASAVELQQLLPSISIL